jgi:hypothetical protein
MTRNIRAEIDRLLTGPQPTFTRAHVVWALREIDRLKLELADLQRAHRELRAAFADTVRNDRPSLADA